MVQARSWTHKTWVPRGVDAQILCPADGVSKGWLVLVKGKEGKPSFMITTLCYSNLQSMETPKVEQEQPELAQELLNPKSKADGGVVQSTGSSEDPPLPPPPFPRECERSSLTRS